MDERYCTQRPIDVICMGRAAVDLYAEQVGANLEQASTFRKALGGSAASVAISCSRQGLRSALLSRVGDDDMGQFVRKQLQVEGVDLRLTDITPEHFTALVLNTVAGHHSAVMPYQVPSADLQLRTEQCDADAFAQAKSFLLTADCLSTESLRTCSEHALTMAKQQRTAIIFDMDCHAALWDFNADSKYYQRVLPYCDLVLGTEHSFCLASGETTLSSALAILHELTQATLVVKTVDGGCQIYAGQMDQPLLLPGYSVPAVNPLVSGEAFVGGFLRGWLRGQSLSTCACYANAAVALNVSRSEGVAALPGYQEVRHFISCYDEEISVEDWDTLNRLHQQLLDKSQPELAKYLLAFDHRIQFESSCHVKEMCAERISEFKKLVYQAFLLVAQKQPGCGLLLDPVYGQSLLNDANAQGIPVGVPVELAGSMPLQWLGGRSLYRTLLAQPAHWFVKVLWHFHPSMEHELRAQQTQRLLQLFEVCKQLGRQLMLELVIPADYSASGKEVVSIIEHVYSLGVYPHWWRLAALSSATDWQLVEQILQQYDPHAQVVLRGGNCQQRSVYRQQFALVQQIGCTKGFAIGRSIFWSAWVDWVEGIIDDQQAVDKIAANYRAFIEMWQNALEKEASFAHSS